MTIFWRWCLTLQLMVAAHGFMALPAYAEDYQSLDSITAAAVAAGETSARQRGYNKVSVNVRALDQRLRLPLCNKPLSTSIPQSDQILGSVSIGVACTGSKPWTIYIRTHISAQRSVPVLARTLARNTIITKADLKLVDQSVEGSTPGMVFDPQQIIGMELTRSLNAGSTVRISHLRPPKVIKRGQQVTLVTGLGGLEVRIQGKALRDAAAGERVAVTNLSSGKQIEGTAHSDGTVSVP